MKVWCFLNVNIMWDLILSFLFIAAAVYLTLNGLFGLLRSTLIRVGKVRELYTEKLRLERELTEPLPIAVKQRYEERLKVVEERLKNLQ